MSITDRTTIQNISKNLEDLNTVKQLDKGNASKIMHFTWQITNMKESR